MYKENLGIYHRNQRWLPALQHSRVEPQTEPCLIHPPSVYEYSCADVCISMFPYVCSCVLSYVPMCYSCAHACVFMCVCVLMCVFVGICVCSHVRVYICVHMSLYSCSRVNSHACRYACKCVMFTCVHVHVEARV